MRRCFVISPIGSSDTSTRENADAVFDFIIQPALQELGIEAIRADKLAGPGQITEQMIAAIVDYDFCIADLSGHNPNVFYELALAQAAERPVILMKLQGEPVPFDVRHYRLVEYDLKPRSLMTRKWIPVLSDHVAVILQPAYTPPRLLPLRRPTAASLSAGLDLSRVQEQDGVFLTRVGQCEVRVVSGRDRAVCRRRPCRRAACNEYFDDRCVDDTKSSLGAYAKEIFAADVPAFVSLIKEQAANRFGPGVEKQKTPQEFAFSFGVGRSLLLLKPLDRSTPVALVSTTTQRAGEGLSSRISCLFEGLRALVGQLADERISEVVMPLLGSGHGCIEKPLALVGLLLAIAEVVQYGQGGQHLRNITIVVFRRDADAPPEVDPVVVRRALALIGR
jgi:hypothetical protein